MNGTQVRNLLLLFFAIAIAVPLPLQVALDLARHDRVHALDVFRKPPTSQNLRAYEEAVAQDLAVAQPVRRRYHAAWDRTLRRGTAKVAISGDDWLFLIDELKYVASEPLTTEAVDARDVILDYQKQLADRGIPLVMVTVPPKVALAAEHLDRTLPADAVPNTPRMRAWLADLDAHGVPVIELTEPLLRAKKRGVAPFLARDSHWTPEGAAIAGAFVGARLRSLPASRSVLGAPHVFEHHLVTYRRHGDLNDMLGYARDDSVFPPMTFTLEEVLRSTSADASVLLLGDSYSAIFGDPEMVMGRDGGFAAHLAEELGEPVDVIAVPGGGPNGARATLAVRESLAGKKLVVWEISERSILDPAMPWRRVKLPPAEPPAKQAAAADVELHVRARLAAVSKSSEGGAYADCLVVLRYEQLDPPSTDPLFVVAWGKRGYVATPVASWAVGTVQALTLVPAAKRVALEHNCLSDEVGLDRQPFWADAVVP